MKKIYSIPLALVSITAVALGISNGISKDGIEATVNSALITENATMGFDYEYSFSIPEIQGDARLVVRLPKSARPDPVALFTDDSGSREFYDQPEVRNEREIVYKDVKAGSYHFVYTSTNKNDTLDETSVTIEE